MPVTITHAARIAIDCRSITKVIRAINLTVIMLLLLRSDLHRKREDKNAMRGRAYPRMNNRIAALNYHARYLYRSRNIRE